MAKIYNNQHKTCNEAGFTAIELLAVLLIMVSIIFISLRMLTAMRNHSESSTLSDQYHDLSNIATKYLTDNYRYISTVVTSDNLIIPFAQLNAYYPSGLNIYNQKQQLPCLYITKNSNNTISPYLLFANNNNTPLANFTYIQSINIVHNIGANAGVLTATGANYVVLGGMDNNFSLSNEQMRNLLQKCNFNQELPKYTIIINLNQGNVLFNALKTITDKQNTNNDTDPNLKKSGDLSATTMQTNLYFDNVAQESSNKTTFFCNSSLTPLEDASKLCNLIAMKNNYIIKNGSISWFASVPDPNDQHFCQSIAQANFLQNIYGYTCAGVAFPDVNQFCGGQRGAEELVLGSAYWQPNINNPIGNQCEASAYGQYQLPSDCDFHCDVSHNHDLCNCPQLNQLCDQSHGWWPRDMGSTFGGRKISQNSCHVEFWCSNTADNYSWVSATVPANTHPLDQVNCGISRVNAKTVQTKQIDLGINQCGTTLTAAFESKYYTPELHLYQNLKFIANSSDQTAITIKTNASDGNISDNNQLNINNGGLAGGYLMPVSHFIKTGSPCSANEIGKIGQMAPSEIAIIGGQLQCTYNPAFCSNNSYCYLPSKNAGFIYQYNPLIASDSCPDGTLVADNQPSDGVITNNPNINCPNESGYILLNGIHGAMTNCQNKQTGLSVCNTYHTICSYRDKYNNTQDVEVAALYKLRCTAETTYIVNVPPPSSP